MLSSTGPDVFAAVDMNAAALKAVLCNKLGNIQYFRSQYFSDQLNTKSTLMA
jgi:hypothetical protein